ncbi:hypothetical protein Psuf_022400 [Phytohabitans suffuscus]|uniref:Uncharacterized protein n=1 Tax=Phytohabitans suffuscus TaxID=624315 RepID=A0A6F8YFT1_9ACTN|nr:hypothetical protein Psuf_022400 [Phytohabitans suffuscus]
MPVGRSAGDGHQVDAGGSGEWADPGLHGGEKRPVAYGGTGLLQDRARKMSGPGSPANPATAAIAVSPAGEGRSGWRSCRPRTAESSSTASRLVRLSSTRRSLTVAAQPIETWSSCMPEVGRESTEAGEARRRFSATMPAAVYWAIIRPELTPGSGERNAGRSRERQTSSSRSTRRSEIAPTSAAAIAMKSAAKPSGAPWKLPVDSTRPSGSTTGLSTTLDSSRWATWAANASVSRAAPATWGAQRIEYASWTACTMSLRCESMIPEFWSRRWMLAADTAWPGCGRIACSSGWNGRSVPSIASIASAAVRSAIVNRCVASSIASSSMPSMPSVPLTSARPSFAESVTGRSPARCSASPPSTRVPDLSSTHPSPSSTSAQWASGARSPEAPSEPCSGTHGVTSWLSRSTSACAISGRTPERPSASDRTRSSIIARTTSRGIGSPTPAACERISACWSSARRSGATNVLASAPKPVETP